MSRVVILLLISGRIVTSIQKRVSRAKCNAAAGGSFGYDIERGVMTSVYCKGGKAERGRRIVGRWSLEDDGYSPPGDDWLGQLERNSVGGIK